MKSQSGCACEALGRFVFLTEETIITLVLTHTLKYKFERNNRRKMQQKL